MRRNIYRYIIPIVTTILLVVWASYYFFGPKYDVRQFNGSLVKIEENTITLEGAFYAPMVKLPEKFLSGRKLTFRVNESTSLSVEVIHLPSQQEIMKAGGKLRYKLDERPSSGGPSSFEELTQYFTESGTVAQNQIFVEATFDKSIFRSRKPIATVVKYQVLSQPLFLPPQ